MFSHLKKTADPSSESSVLEVSTGVRRATPASTRRAPCNVRQVCAIRSSSPATVCACSETEDALPLLEHDVYRNSRTRETCEIRRELRRDLALIGEHFLSARVIAVALDRQQETRQIRHRLLHAIH